MRDAAGGERNTRPDNGASEAVQRRKVEGSDERGSIPRPAATSPGLSSQHGTPKRLTTGQDSADVGQGETIEHSEPSHAPSRPADAALLVWADALDDLEQTRIATENRLRSLDQVKHAPEVSGLGVLLTSIEAAEHQAILGLQRAMREHPLGDWVKRTVGVGEKQAARLLAAIGDPASRSNPAKLWAYCGYHVLANGGGDSQSRSDTHVAVGVAPRRRRGEAINWNPEARKRTWLIASSCIKKRHSPYRSVYDEARTKYADAVHSAPCPNCKQEAGGPLSDGHKHARALRLVAKRILLDLWKEATTIGKEEAA